MILYLFHWAPVVVCLMAMIALFMKSFHTRASRLLFGLTAMFIIQFFSDVQYVVSADNGLMIGIVDFFNKFLILSIAPTIYIWCREVSNMRPVRPAFYLSTAWPCWWV